MRLQRYVRYYWSATVGSARSVLTFPTGCPQIIFHRKAPLYIPELGKSQYPLTVSGQVNFPSHVAVNDCVEMIVAVFHPHTIGEFIATPPSEFYNMEISGFDLGCRELCSLYERVAGCADEAECVGMIDSWLLGRLRYVHDISRIGASVGALLGDTSMSVRALASEACLGERQFERVFREHVGMNPKEYIRVVRFQKALWLMQTGALSDVSIACDCGYADQSHFIREFKTFAGLTPRQLVKETVPCSDLFGCPA